jgi:pyruvate-ferredoxin/flavodoxin oxidoreductase
VAARVFPLFQYHPEGEGVFGSRISLEHNPAPCDTWVTGPDETPLTPALWALEERRFSDCFLPLKADDPEPTPMADYLELPEKERLKRTPFLAQNNNGQEPRRLRIDRSLVRISDERIQVWRMLQELAGLVTPFTARVRQEAAAQVAAERDAELKALAEEYDQQIGDLRAALREETRREMRQRLMQLAGYRDSSVRESG